MFPSRIDFNLQPGFYIILQIKQNQDKRTNISNSKVRVITYQHRNDMITINIDRLMSSIFAPKDSVHNHDRLINVRERIYLQKDVLMFNVLFSI